MIFCLAPFPLDMQHNNENSRTISYQKQKRLHRPGVEPGPIAWKAIILPLDHRSDLYKGLAFLHTYNI